MGLFLDEVSGDALQKILKDTPDHIVNLIADIYLAFQLKANIPPDEAETNAGKVRKKKVAQLFEHATFGDLYADSQRIKKQIEGQKNQLAELDKQLAERDKQLAEQDKQLAEQDKQLTMQRNQLTEAEHGREKGIELYVELLYEIGTPYEKACQVLQEKYELPENEAKKKIEKYWK